jgi:hypothetical protein
MQLPFFDFFLSILLLDSCQPRPFSWAFLSFAQEFILHNKEMPEALSGRLPAVQKNFIKSTAR